jgi:hypothetical protein
MESEDDETEAKQSMESEDDETEAKQEVNKIVVVFWRLLNVKSC